MPVTISYGTPKAGQYQEHYEAMSSVTMEHMDGLWKKAQSAIKRYDELKSDGLYGKNVWETMVKEGFGRYASRSFAMGVLHACQTLDKELKAHGLMD
jgi:hypothetical protein